MSPRRRPRRPGRAAVGRDLWRAIVVLVALSVGASPGSAAAEEGIAARLFVEAVRVEGARGQATETIVLEEARIRPGREYDEAELWEAAHRVERLPFVLDATPSLEKGSARGRHVLLLRVVETERVFFAVEENLTLFDEAVALSSGRPETSSHVRRGLAGGRLFLGRSVELFAGADTERGVQGGLAWYGLFGRGGTARFTAGYHDFCCQSLVPALGLDLDIPRLSLAHRTLRLDLDLAVPIRRNQALRLTASRLTTDEPTEWQLFDREEFVAWDGARLERVELSWISDSTDDPFLPRRGSRSSVGVDGQWLDRGEAGAPIPVSLRRPDRSSRLARLSAGYTRHHEVGLRQTISWGGRAAFGEGEIDTAESDPVDSTTWELSAQVAHRWMLWSGRELGARPEVWWETGLELSREEAELGDRADPLGLDRFTVRTGPILRSTWGLFRLTLSYVDLEGDGR